MAEVINETSEAGPDTPFIDGDGGFLRVPQNIFCKQRTTCGDPTHFRKFKHWKVFARNAVLDEIVNQARETYLSQNPYADHIQSHLHSYTAKYYADHFESDLYKEVAAASKAGQSVRHAHFANSPLIKAFYQRLFNNLAFQKNNHIFKIIKFSKINSRLNLKFLKNVDIKKSNFQ